MTADDDVPPLLEAWGKFAAMCLHGQDPRVMSDQMMSFFAGASVVVGLVRSAAEQGGDDEAALAFAQLGEETDAFAELILYRMDTAH